MKVLAFAGSTSSASINRKLVDYTLSLFNQDEVNHINLSDFDMPLFSVDKESDAGIPEQAQKFIKAIEEADAIVCSFAEHNGTFAAAFKNIFDWSSRTHKSVFQDKPMFLMATSPGGFGGKNVLGEAERIFPRYGANIKAVFSLPNFAQNFDDKTGKIINQELREEHSRLVEDFRNKVKNQ